ncbi:MAG: hypothetical protein PHT14_07080 [Petrimonas sp.]|jgi:hypothetical protein|uniref:Uncharacterized protein n=1 Tax=bioreactor metagenome TaxID=1076179 RepID=A0A644ZKB3_9ZZZZ|nr:hypothetical protein [Petrimonas sp.]NLU30198.1 hypothetical protein [Bacteroidales bacterium]HBF96267.1 hypothetical protein [Porphyromonadaceae bacterium]MDD2910110.1 hypothetical protein [Petrimonas sp.]MDD3541533.1 hypothetical protein [Petrimonas sp.]
MKLSAYTPIDPDFFDLFQQEIKKGSVKVIYFDANQFPHLKESNGKVTAIVSKQESGQFMVFENGDEVRTDRIIVYNGKPGPAYDEYDAYALAPLTCKAGYDDDDC